MTRISASLEPDLEREKLLKAAWCAEKKTLSPYVRDQTTSPVPPFAEGGVPSRMADSESSPMECDMEGIFGESCAANAGIEEVALHGALHGPVEAMVVDEAASACNQSNGDGNDDHRQSGAARGLIKEAEATMMGPATRRSGELPAQSSALPPACPQPSEYQFDEEDAKERVRKKF